MADNKDEKIRFAKKDQIPDTTQGIKNIKDNKQPTRTALKGSREEESLNKEQPRRRNAVLYTREEAKKIAQQIGAELLRKQASPKERDKEDQKVVQNIARKAKAGKRSQGR